ncbi:MAG: HAMP domain-containing histidine kinase [Burkholderiaceae bacterium]|nr:HAMP domain-containing histidine kinase [Burkholderiaceae bacterium]
MAQGPDSAASPRRSATPAVGRRSARRRLPGGGEAAGAAQLAAAAEEARRAQAFYFAAAWHDLRQPMQALALLAEALQRRARDGEDAELAARVAESVTLLDGLFAQLLDLGRLEAGALVLRPRAFQLGELYDRVRPHFEPVAFDKGLALRFRGAAQWVQADPALVERVLRNLLANALRYTRDGGVLVGCRPRGTALSLQVWDSGVGIEPEALPRVFDAFQQPSRDVAAGGAGHCEAAGCGLGLAIVRRLVQRMGSRIEVASRPGRGSVFSLTLPRAGAAVPAPQSGPA